MKSVQQFLPSLYWALKLIQSCSYPRVVGSKFVQGKQKLREHSTRRVLRHDLYSTLIIFLEDKDSDFSPIRHPKPVFVNTWTIQRGHGHDHVTLVLHKPPVAGFKLRGHLNLGNLLLEGPITCFGGEVNHSGEPIQPPLRLSFLRLTFAPWIT